MFFRSISLCSGLEQVLDSRVAALDYGTDLVLMKVFLTIPMPIILKGLTASKFGAARAAYA